MMWERNRARTELQIENLLRMALPALLTIGGVLYVWRMNQARLARQARQRDSRYERAVSGPRDHLPHSDPGEDTVEAASEDSFPASDPPAYTAQDRLGTPAR